MPRLSGLVAIVTGSGYGIGKAIALRLASEDATIIVSDLKHIQKEGEDTVNKIKEKGGKAVFIVCDVTSAQAVKSLMNEVMERYGRIDILVNNAGIPHPTVPIDQIEEMDYERVFSVNLGGVYRCCKYGIPFLEKTAKTHNRKSSIINIASTFGMVGAPNTSAYAASKGGVISLTKQLAVECGSRNIRVNAIAPGYIDNDFGLRRKKMIPSDAKQNLDTRNLVAGLQPLGRQGDTTEVAHVAAFLASEESSFITGIVLPVDGGCTVTFNLGYRPKL